MTLLNGAPVLTNSAANDFLIRPYYNENFCPVPVHRTVLRIMLRMDHTANDAIMYA